MNTRFLELVEGSNVVRIISKPYKYMAHANKVIEGNPEYGQKILCNRITNDDLKCDFCPVMDIYNVDNKANQATDRWIVAVIDRRHNDVAFLDMGVKTFSIIRKYATNHRWGDPEKYDIDLDLGPYYAPTMVSPIVHPPEAMSQRDKMLQEMVDLDELQMLTDHSKQAKHMQDIYDGKHFIDNVIPLI